MTGVLAPGRGRWCACVRGGLISATGDDEADAAVSEEFELEFVPGTVARLGEELPPSELPQKIVTQDRRAPDAVPETPPGKAE